MMKYEKSCGAIVFRHSQRTREYLLIKHRKGGHWGFPKGHVEEGETDRQTALREVYEETGLNIRVIEGFKEEERYSPTYNVHKTVVYFLAEAVTEDVVYILPEVEAHIWLNAQEACQHLTFESQQALIVKAEDFLQQEKG